MQKMQPACGETPQLNGFVASCSSFSVATATDVAAATNVSAVAAAGAAADAISFSTKDKPAAAGSSKAAETSPFLRVSVADALPAPAALSKGALAAPTAATKTPAAAQNASNADSGAEAAVPLAVGAATPVGDAGNSPLGASPWGLSKGALGPFGVSPVSCPLPLSAAVMGEPWAPPTNMNIWHSPSLSPVGAFMKSGEDSPGAPPEEALARPPFGTLTDPSGENQKGLSEAALEVPSGAARDDLPVLTPWGPRDSDAASESTPATAPRGHLDEAHGERASGGPFEAVTNAFLEWCSSGDSAGRRGHSGGRSDGWGTRKQVLEGLAERCHRQQLELQQQREQKQVLLMPEQRHQQQEGTKQKLPLVQLLQQNQAKAIQQRPQEQQELQHQGEQLPTQQQQTEQQEQRAQEDQDGSYQQQQHRKRFSRRLSHGIRCMPSLVEAFLVLGPPAASPVLDCCIGRYCQQPQEQQCSCCCCQVKDQQEVSASLGTAVADASGEGAHDCFVSDLTPMENEREQQQQQQQEIPRTGTNGADNVETSSSTSSNSSNSSDLLQPHVWWCCTCKRAPCFFPEGTIPPDSSRCSSSDSSRNRRSCASSFCGSSRVLSLCSQPQRRPSDAASVITGSSSCSSSSYRKRVAPAPARRRCSSSCPNGSNEGTSSRRVNSCLIPGYNWSNDPLDVSGIRRTSRRPSSSLGSITNVKSARVPHFHAVRAPTGAVRICASQLKAAEVGQARNSCASSSSSTNCYGGSSRRSYSDGHARGHEGTGRRSSSWPMPHSAASVAPLAVVEAGGTASAAGPGTDAASTCTAAVAPAMAADGVRAVAPASKRVSKQSSYSPAVIRCRVRGVCSCGGGGSSSSCCKVNSRGPQCWKWDYIPSFDVAATRKGKPKVLTVPHLSEAAQSAAADPAAAGTGPARVAGTAAVDAAEGPVAADPGTETDGEGSGNTSWLPPEVPPAAELFCFPEGTAKVLPVSSGCLCTLLHPPPQHKQKKPEAVVATRPCTSPWQSYLPRVLTGLLSPGVCSRAAAQEAPSSSVLEPVAAASPQMLPQPGRTWAATTPAAAPARASPCICQWGGCPCASLLRVHSPSSSVFVLTDFQGRRLYGHCLRFFELVTFRVPNSRCTMLSNSGSAAASVAVEGDAMADAVMPDRVHQPRKISGEASAVGTEPADGGSGEPPPLAYVERAFCVLSELPFFGVFHEWLWCTYTSYAALCQATACSARGHIVLQKQQQVQQRVLLPSPLLYLQQQATRLVEETPAPVAAHMWEVFPLQQVQMRCETSRSSTGDYNMGGRSNYSSSSINKLRVSVSIECTRSLHFALPPPGSLPLLQVGLLRCNCCWTCSCS